jgi:hypothetical protein
MAPQYRTAALLITLAASIASREAGAQTRPDRAKPLPTPASTEVEVARVGFLEGPVEVMKPGTTWTKALQDQPLAVGDRVRTLRGGTVRLEFPWTAVAVGDSSEVSIEKTRLLTLQLESGRIDVDPEQALLRIITAEASVSGVGRTLVRRLEKTTFVGSYNGGADVEGAGASVRLGVNSGTIVASGLSPTPPAPMAPPPRVVSPASDPRYVRPGEAVLLTWTGQHKVYNLEILPIDSDVPTISIEVAGLSYEAKLPWLGTYRWRVAGREGVVESQPSGEGLICVVDK